MCCFSGKVEKVAATNIFARPSARGDRQFLVYNMLFSAKSDLAMILPIPTPKKSKENAVKFISLKAYPAFFKDMLKGFPQPRSKGGDKKGHDKDDKKPLKVVEVGAFQASFVPTVKDFDRLDAAFKLPKGTWDKLPDYKDYGFAVFKLKKGQEQHVHPMAFDFPRGDTKRLFFPTVHIHDGKVHKTATFDHALYCQGSGDDLLKWKESARPASTFVKVAKTAGIVDKDSHVYRLVLKGRKTNKDFWMS